MVKTGKPNVSDEIVNDDESLALVLLEVFADAIKDKGSDHVYLQVDWEDLYGTPESATLYWVSTASQVIGLLAIASRTKNVNVFVG